MIFLPIVGRELRIAARRRGTYWARTGAALTVLLVWLVLLIGSRRLAPAELSHRLFIAFGVLALGFCLLAGLFLTADCLSEEKREGTLGLLFLTDLRGYDVVLGKLAATSMHAGYGLLAVFPVLGLPLLLGGVTVGEFGRVVLVLLATLLLSLGLGLLVSALCRELRQAMAATLFGLLVVAGLLPVVWWAQYVFRVSKLNALLWPSPIFTFVSALDGTYRTRIGAHDFWLSLRIVFLLGVACLVVAALILPRVWQEDKVSGSLATNKVKASRTQPGDKTWRSPLLEVNSFGWLLSRGRFPRGPAALMFVLFSLWFCFLIASILTAHQKEAFVVALFTAYAMHQLLKYTLTSEGTRQLSEDRRSGALELLLVSPLQDAEIIQGHQHAMARRFRGLIWLMMLVNASLSAAVLVFHEKLSMSGDDQAMFLELFVGGSVVLWLDVKTLTLLSISMALRVRRHHRAILATLGRVQAAPWAAIFLLIFIISAGGVSQEAAMVIFGGWFGLGILADLMLLAMAHGALSQGVRGFMMETRPGPAETWTPNSLTTAWVQKIDTIPLSQRLTRPPTTGLQ